MTDIVQRLRFDAARCEVEFSKGVAGNIEEAAAEIERLRAALDPFARHAHCTNEIQPSNLALWCAQALNALCEQRTGKED